MSQTLTTSNIYKFESSFWPNLILIRLQCRLDVLNVCICSVHYLANWRSGPGADLGWDDECCRHRPIVSGPGGHRTQGGGRMAEDDPGHWAPATLLSTSCWPRQWTVCRMSLVRGHHPLVSSDHSHIRHEAMGQWMGRSNQKIQEGFQRGCNVCDIFGLLKLLDWRYYTLRYLGLKEPGPRTGAHRPGWNCWASLARAHAGLRSSLSSLGAEWVSPHSSLLCQ